MRVSRSINKIIPEIRSSLRSISLSISSSLSRTEVMNGITYLVFPVISKVGDNVEWSINAPYPELVPSSVLSLATESRNGRPIVMDHPYDITKGEYVSANDPAVLEQYCFGYFFNAYFDYADNKVKGELWLDESRASQVGDNAVECIDRLKNGELVEVSEGNFVLIEEEEGTINGKDYKAKWLLAIPDHLALLPTNTKGACSVEDGCGANRLSGARKNMKVMNGRYSSIELSTPSSLSVSAMTQARKPKYSGTESSTWEKPTFADYVKYLFNGDNPPTGVAQCTAELKREIADHTLAGDENATSFNDLSKFPVVNPSTGKLNENALRAVMSGRGMSADMDEKLKSSCQDMARRLLNSEFSANLELKSKDMKDPKMMDSSAGDNDMSEKSKGMFQRIVNGFSKFLKASMSNSLLRGKLEDAIREKEPGLWWLEDYDTDAKTVVYTTRMVLGMEYDGTVEMHCWRRTYNVDANGNVTVNDDAVEVQFVGTYEPVVEGEPNAEIKMSKDNKDNKPDQPCTCNDKGKEKGDSTMAISERKKTIVSKLLASCNADGKVKQEDLEKLEESTLELMLTMSEGKADKEVVTKEAKETKEVATPDPESITVSKADYAKIVASADAYNKEQEKLKTELVSTLKASQDAFTEDELSKMDITQLEKLIKVSGSKSPTANLDWSGSRTFGNPSDGKTYETPDTWGLNTKTN